MKNEILIGRQVGKEDFPVDEKYRSVSRMHAKIIRKHDGIYLEDLDSAHGTFVNGSRVRVKKIGRSDTVLLGGADGYRLDVNEVLKKLPLSNEELSRKFMELKNVYAGYRAERSRLESGMQSTMIVRMAPTLLLGSFTTLGTVFFEDNRTIIVVGGAILTILAFGIASMWATQRNKQLKDELHELDEKFELEYVCPNCGSMFRGKSWETIRRSGKCPACKREFTIKS